MVDSHGNAFLIDLDSWRCGPALGDVAHLEGFTLFDYTDVRSPAELDEALGMVRPLVSTYGGPGGAAATAGALPEASAIGLTTPQLRLAYETVCVVRGMAADLLVSPEGARASAASSFIPLEAAAPLLTRALMFVFAPQQADKTDPAANKKFALAMACALCDACEGALSRA